MAQRHPGERRNKKRHDDGGLFISLSRKIDALSDIAYGIIEHSGEHYGPARCVLQPRGYCAAESRAQEVKLRRPGTPRPYRRAVARMEGILVFGTFRFNCARAALVKNLPFSSLGRDGCPFRSSDLGSAVLQLLIECDPLPLDHSVLDKTRISSALFPDEGCRLERIAGEARRKPCACPLVLPGAGAQIPLMADDFSFHPFALMCAEPEACEC